MPFRLLIFVLVACLAASTYGQISPSEDAQDRRDSLEFQIEVLERQISQLQHLRDDQRSNLMEGPEILRMRAFSLLRKAHLQGQASDPRIESLHRLLGALSIAEPETAPARTAAPESENARWVVETRLKASELDLDTAGPPKQTAELFQGSEHCEDAPVLTAGTWLGQTGQTTDGASRCDLTSFSTDVWYRVLDHDLEIDSFGSATDLVLSVHESCPTAEESNEDYCSSGPQARVSGGDYYLRVSNLLGETGSYLLRAASSRGRIEGRVTHEITGAPLEGITIIGPDDFTSTNEDGRYVFENVKSGVYSMATANTPGLLDETYPQLVEALIGTTVSNIDFTLGPGGIVSGEIRDRESTELIADAMVVLETQDQLTVTSTLTDDAGRYRISGLTPGIYRLYVTTDGAYVEHRYPGVDCLASCRTEPGSVLQVPLGELAGIDLTLARPATVSGVVTALADGSPIADATVVAYEDVEDGIYGFLTSTTTNAEGAYTLAISADSAQVAAYRSTHPDGSYLQRLYPGPSCPFLRCPHDQGQDLAVSVGDSVENIDFSLQPAGRIHASFDLPGFDHNATINLSIFDESSLFRRLWTYTYTESYPDFLIDLLPAGSYRLKAEPLYDPQWLDLIYPDILCLTDDCDIAQGDLIPVTLGQTTSDVHFVLPSPDRVAGRVLDDATSTPLAYATVHAWLGLNAEQPFATTMTDLDGTFELLALEPVQRFYLTAEIESHRRGLYNGGACEGSPGSSGCPAAGLSGLNIGVGGAQTDIEFRLVERPVGHIEGFISIRNEGGLFGPTVHVAHADTGVETLGETLIGGSGQYRVENLDPGTYYAWTPPYDAWDAQAYDDQLCFTGSDGEAECPLGTPITVRAGETTTGIDFELDYFGHLDVTMVDEITGENIAVEGSRMHLWSENGTLVDTSFGGDGLFQFRQLRQEYYYLTTELNNGYIDGVAGGDPCFPGTACELTSGTVIQGLYFHGNSLIFSARRGGDITGTVTSSEGEPLRSTIKVWDSEGSPVKTVQVENGGYAVTGLPDGDYVLSAEAPLRFEELYPDIRCPQQGCDPSLGQPITVSEGRLVTGIDFELDRRQTCDPTTDLCLGDGRFRVTSQRLDALPGAAFPELLTLDSGYFWFFDSNNVEVVVKVLDACGINDRFWIFAAGLTDLEVELTVTDLATGLEKVFTSTGGQAFPPILDTEGLAGCDQVFPVTHPSTETFSTVPPSLARISHQPSAATPYPPASTASEADSAPQHAASCLASQKSSSTLYLQASPASRDEVDEKSGLEKLADCTADGNSLCLTQNRFRVTSQWQSQDASGLGGAQAITADTGYFWFFDPDNLELVIKVLDACAINDKFWVFTSGLTEVGVELQVEDTITGTTWDLETHLGNPFQPVFDTQALDCP